ncbi:hypothetical protein [Imhoffiella purpurea]|uniref:Uncharacterized protein n=1 Tax=Imhoffiella purpurea TaxID=1249627 RepID=W9VBH3_9GAMM|nr:hypothetical protein [Imhoffiella purpurea]EXJ16928.1 hypothetical protein D779_1751 [Imhoffiella purpurea]
MTRREAGLTLVLMDRLRTQRLPRLQAMHARVTAGDCLDAHDLRYLCVSLEETQRMKSPSIDTREAIRAVLARLYHEITTQALSNEQARFRHAAH